MKDFYALLRVRRPWGSPTRRRGGAGTLPTLALTVCLFLVLGAAQAQSPRRPDGLDSLDALEAVVQRLREQHLHQELTGRGRRDRAGLERAMRAYDRAQDSVLHAWHERQTGQGAEERLPADEGTFAQQSLSASADDEGLVPDAVELQALRDLYAAAGGAGWANSANWLQGTSSADFAAWHGVTVRNGDVVAVSLISNRLSGTIPPSLGSLTGLQTIQLSGNALTGTIPAELGNLSSLQTLNLYQNGLSGPIPPSLGSLSGLRTLQLYENSLSGPIPPELGNLARLGSLRLMSNRLSGPIPPELGRLRNLQLLYLNTNQLTGPIPAELGNLTGLQTLWLSSNQLTGPIPAALGKLTGLRYIYLYSNRLSGPIPAELGDMANLQSLYLYNNGLTGPIPAELGRLQNLGVLYLSNNSLSGPVPAALGGLQNLGTARLNSNGLSGALPAGLAGLAGLQRLELHNNAFTSLPDFSQKPNRSTMTLFAQGNRLDFGSIEPQMAGAGQSLLGGFTYSPQGLLGEPVSVELAAGEPLELAALSGGGRNLYRWERRVNGVWQAVAGAASARYLVPSATAADAGAYRCRVTNGWATALTLYTHEFTVTVTDEALVRLAPNLPTEDDCQ